MPYTIYITETTTGYASFDNKEDAETSLEEPDYDRVKWTDTLESKCELILDEDEDGDGNLPPNF